MRFLFSHTNDAAQLVSNPSPDCAETLRVLFWNPRVDYYWSWPQQFGDSFSQPIHSTFPYNICMKISVSGSGKGRIFCFGHIQDSLNNIGGTRILSWELQFPSPHAHTCHFSLSLSPQGKAKSLYTEREREKVGNKQSSSCSYSRNSTEKMLVQ